MSDRNALSGTILNVVRVLFLFLLIAVVLLFILAKSGGTEDEEAAEGEEQKEVPQELAEGEFGKGGLT